MSNFAVNCSDEIINQGNALIAKLAAGTDEKKADTLKRIFDIVEKDLGDITMRENGVDTKGLDAALSDIRKMFESVSNNRERLLGEKDQQITKLQNEKAALKSTFNAQIRAAAEERDVAVQSAEKAKKDIVAAQKQADTATSLANEKEKINSMLTAKLADAEEKLSGYDALKTSEQSMKTKAADLQREIDQLKKEHASEISALQKDAAIALSNAVTEKAREMQEKYNALEAHSQEEKERILDLQREIDQLKKDQAAELSAQKKDASIALERAVTEKEREMQKKIQTAELETARMTGKIEMLEARIRELTAKTDDKDRKTAE